MHSELCSFCLTTRIYSNQTESIVTSCLHAFGWIIHVLSPRLWLDHSFPLGYPFTSLSDLMHILPLLPLEKIHPSLQLPLQLWI